MTKITLFNTSRAGGAKATKSAKAAKVGEPAPGEYGLQVDEDGSVTVFGVNSAGEQVDISAVAGLEAMSSDATILEVETPDGMSCKYHARGVGKAVVTLTVTSNEVGKFHFEIGDPCDVDKNAVRGATINHGTPTVR